MDGDVKTQGTHLYVVDPGGGTPALVKFTCPTGITGVTSGAADQIETTCLDETEAKTYERGLDNPGAVNVPFNLKPSDASHQFVFELKKSGDTVQWMVCLSESADPPTLTGGEMTAPTTRTCFEFDGYVSELGIDIATNEIVRGTMVIQRTGPVTPTWFTPA